MDELLDGNRRFKATPPLGLDKIGSIAAGIQALSGTGPKAGGPHYVARFATERVTCIDTTAAGGNATLMAAIEG